MTDSAVQQTAAITSELEDSIRRHLRQTLCRNPDQISPDDLFTAVALSCRSRFAEGMIDTETRFDQAGAKRLYYLSMEFLMGRSLGNNLINLGIYREMDDALSRMGHRLSDVLESEFDPGLGNGGLGRLAACFLDSLASRDLPGYGYGIRYDFGLFRQEFRDGFQYERPDHWLSDASPWLIERPSESVIVPLYGHIEHAEDQQGNYNPMWLGWDILIGVPYDLPVVGYGGETVTTLRLFSARAPDEFNMAIFNQGDYVRAVMEQIQSETVSKVLYPSDEIPVGKELRLIQEYFLVACTVRDIVRRYEAKYNGFEGFSSQVAIQLNDTHPALTVAELMRLLVDEQQMEWETAWRITQETCGYTNHTLLPEALEVWPVSLLERVLPRHMQLIFEINQRFLGEVKARWPGEDARLARMSLIAEGGEKQVRMANLAIVGSHAVNGVAAVHSELVKHQLVPDFYEMWPEKFSNKTNGVTQRRWMLLANPGLSALITEALGEGWVRDLSLLQGLTELAEDSAFNDAFRQVKTDNKSRLAGLIRNTTHIQVDPGTLFDVQAKRIHEYKRQLLMIMQVIHSYLRAVEDGHPPRAPRTCIFAGKAAPGYFMAKRIIKLINSVAETINADQRLQGMLRVVFIPDYKVSVAERIFPGADLSEQISTAGTEASGTGNMKFAMNGALTIGTLDGANIEISEAVGADNIFIFGLSVEQVKALRERGYDPRELYQASDSVRRVVDAIASNRFCPRDPGLFSPIIDSLLGADHYLLLTDFDDYLSAQARVAELYQSPRDWVRKAILNVANMGRFSSDRTIDEYAGEIWGLRSLRRRA
ncbi:MAG: glycogen/starch/alpha-glucan phosphorylase [Gammaproteobacteria bacterium]|nr:glycogen/starch/alpha-glucan phosphorylase [Gammaproteobacteria bacterium]MBU1653985.1 glycogen/starch/alpha-glucan phosphorylase [Gammaproteobacteria bacterium]MBU1960463.1 glycogen/starch/alpha-glucan phosphorylase [Gammaproteobacteria bacterium]